MDIKDVVIIGAGPAGVAATIQLKRHNIEPILLEKEEIGGLLRNANLVENYPGFPEGIPGHELVTLLKKQLDHIGVSVYFEEVLELDYRNRMFSVTTNQRTFNCRIAVIAAGTTPQELPDISADIEDRIFYEIHRLPQPANTTIAIIGSGDVAFDYALSLSRANNVIILNRGRKLKCLPLLFAKAMRCERISYRENTQVKNIMRSNDGLVLTCHDSVNMYRIDAQYLIHASGRVPCINFISQHLRRNIEQLQKANILHMVGDVRNDMYRQVAISVGDGIKAAMVINEIIRRNNLCGW